MTDMRNFTPSNDTSISADSAFVDSGAGDARESYIIDDSGGLGEFHRRADLEEEGTGRSKLISGLVLALMLGAAGAYAYSMWTPQNEAVADQDLPKPTAPRAAAVAPMMPPVAETMASAPSDTAMNAPATPEAVTPTLITRQQRVANAPRAPESSAPAAPMPAPLAAAPSPATITPPRDQATLPEPLSPTPPVSAVAGNPPLNEQSAAPVDATPVTPTVPAQTAPASQPEPAQPAAPVDQSQ